MDKQVIIPISLLLAQHCLAAPAVPTLCCDNREARGVGGAREGS